MAVLRYTRCMNCGQSTVHEQTCADFERTLENIPHNWIPAAIATLAKQAIRAGVFKDSGGFLPFCTRLAEQNKENKV